MPGFWKWVFYFSLLISIIVGIIAIYQFLLSLEDRSDGQETGALDPVVAFDDEPISITRIKIMNTQKVPEGVVVQYRWISAPEGRFTLFGETWDHSVPGQERMVAFTEIEDVGEIIIPVSDWSIVTHVRVVAVGPSNSWEVSSEHWSIR